MHSLAALLTQFTSATSTEKTYDNVTVTTE